MTIALPANGNQQDGSNQLEKSSFYKLDFERLSINQESNHNETQLNQQDYVPENVTQMNNEAEAYKPSSVIYTHSDIVQKPDDVVNSPTRNSNLPYQPSSTANSSTPTLTHNNLQQQQQQQGSQQPQPQQSPRINNDSNPNLGNNINGSPSFQSARIAYSPSFQHNGVPPSQLRNNPNYNNTNNMSRQPSTMYYLDNNRPPPQQQPVHYRQGAPLPPQPMMSPQQQFIRPNAPPPPPPPSHTYYRPQMRPMMPPPPAPQTFGHSTIGSTMTPLISDNSYLADSSLSVAHAAGKRPKKNQFPPATKENLTMFRQEAMNSNDPRFTLDLAKFLLEAVNQLCVDEQDPKRTKRTREAMILEAQKIVKKLAAHSGMGKQGYPEAQFFLANCYGTGSMGLQTDPEKAFALYVQGSKQSHPGCTFRAAVCYEVGAGTKRDKNHAMQFYRKAANLGDSTAMYKLGMILLKGFLGQPKNPREGISWLKRASQQADEDHPHALHELGLAYEKEGIPSVIPDLNYARELFTQAAQYGYAPSQFKLGLAYENGFLNCPVDPRRSIAWYAKAAEQGDIEAEFALSGWYLTGAEGVLPQSDAEAYLWARKAADRGSAKAEYAVGYYTETGTGTRPNLEEAKRWYMRAAAQNYRRAMQRLTELKYGGARPQQRRKHTREANNTSSNSKDSDCTIM
jgi:TPR repeat protein